MTARDRWPLVGRVFERVLDLPPHDRAAFLEELRYGDAALCDEVRRLLDASDAAGESILERPASELAAPLLREPRPAAAEATPESVGPWRISSLLGEGGMGDVYLAERVDGERHQRGALKIVKPEMDTWVVLDRFRREREILMGLDHPNIARFLDSGATGDGRPYFVLELVEGLPLDQYCDDHGLGTDARIRLVMDICRAVQYAHDKRVLHRDLKPSNIMVGADAKIKLLDFGVAKVLGEGTAGKTTLTAIGLRPLTLGYAAPEHLRGEAVSAAADVYSLGVILYRLLTGVLPFDIGRSELAAARLLTEAGPMPPSRTLHRALPAAQDLDAVVLKALCHEPGGRYASVEALLQDLHCYLERLPVDARSGSLAYRVGGLIRRPARACRRLIRRKPEVE